MRSSAITLFVLLAVACFPGCKGARESTAPGAMLDAGTGAVLVSFPAPPQLRRQDWMAQVTLSGYADTRALPRLPLADLQSLLVLNVPPGKYNVVTFAWQRGQDPAWGGSADSVEVVHGKLTTLRASDLGANAYPYSGIRINASKPVPWSLKSAEMLQDYLAAHLSATAQG